LQRLGDAEDRKPGTGVDPQYGSAFDAFGFGGPVSWKVTPQLTNKISQMINLLITETFMKLENLKSTGERLLRRESTSHPDLLDPMASAYSPRATIHLMHVAFKVAIADDQFCISVSGRCGTVPAVNIAGEIVALFVGYDTPMRVRYCSGVLYTAVGNELTIMSPIEWSGYRISMG
jgi:hypothetical protein